MAEEVIATRFVDAQLTPVEMQLQPGYGAVGAELSMEQPLYHDVLRQLSRTFGGRWLPGRATLTPTKLAFELPPLIQLLRGDDAGVEIDLRTVLRIETRDWFLSGEVIATLPGAVLRVRCRGADEFGEQLQAAVHACRRRPSA